MPANAFGSDPGDGLDSTVGDGFDECSGQLGAKHKFIKPHCPWQNGKVERFNRTLQTEWAYRQVFVTNPDHAAALPPWLDFYNTRRRHIALCGSRQQADCHQPCDRVHLVAACTGPIRPCH
jgi:Integrase core domain